MVGGGIVGGLNIFENAIVSYAQMEEDLRYKIDNIEVTHPGYDEYRRNVGHIGTNPNYIIALILALDDMPEHLLSGLLEQIFNRQYTLVLDSFTQELEIENDDGEIEIVEIYVLEITLTVIPFREAIVPLLTPEQLLQFDHFMSIGG